MGGKSGKKLPKFASGISGTADFIGIAGLKISRKSRFLPKNSYLIRIII